MSRAATHPRFKAGDRVALTIGYAQREPAAPGVAVQVRAGTVLEVADATPAREWGEPVYVLREPGPGGRLWPTTFLECHLVEAGGADPARAAGGLFDFGG